MSIALSKKDAVGASPVPLLDLKAQYAGIRDEIDAAIRDVCESQHFVMGPKVIELENRIAEYSGAQFGIGVSSGTDALLVALMAMDIGPGDEVITTPFTFFATGGVIARLGARPVFCDICEDSFNLDPASVKRFIDENCHTEGDQLIHGATGGRIRVIMPVHLFGQMANMKALGRLAAEYNLRIVEDAAQAIGAEDSDGRRAGSIGDIGCFSFFPSKNLGAFGDGGMCVTSDPTLAEKMKVLRLHGGKPKYYHALIGGNFRLDAIQAAVLNVKLGYLDEWTVARQQNAANYDQLFMAASDVVRTPFVESGVRHIYNQYTLRVAFRDELRQHLAENDIGSEIYYPVPLHLQSCFSYLGYSQGDCPVSESAADNALSIPIYPELTELQQKRVADTCVRFLASKT